MRKCIDCEWMKSLEDSEGRTIYFCMNAKSDAYLGETGTCGSCGCSDYDPCPGDCERVEDDLCSERVETDRLQDAAKDMLEALEEAQKVTYSLYMLPGVKEVDRKICAAIAKAKGGGE